MSHVSEMAETCLMCEKKIVDRTEESIFCEGTCQRWLHRCCAGLTKSQFKKLSDQSSTPFACANCKIAD